MVSNFISVRVVACSLELILKHWPMLISTVPIVSNIFLSLPYVLTLLHIFLRVKGTVLIFSSAAPFLQIHELFHLPVVLCHFIRRTVMEMQVFNLLIFSAFSFNLFRILVTWIWHLRELANLWEMCWLGCWFLKVCYRQLSCGNFGFKMKKIFLMISFKILTDVDSSIKFSI